MIEIDENIVKKNGITFHFIPNKKFKTVNIVFKCKSPLDRSTVTKRTLLRYVLEQGTKNYPTEQALMRRLDELYGAVLTLSNMKKGNEHILHFQLEVANQRFIENESTIMEEALQLFHEIIFEPNRDENGFNEQVEIGRASCRERVKGGTAEVNSYRTREEGKMGQQTTI